MKNTHKLRTFLAMRKEWIAIVISFACLMASCSANQTAPDGTTSTTQHDSQSLFTDAPADTTVSDPTGTQETEGIEDPAFADENHLREVVSAYYASRAEYLSSDGEGLITAAVDGIIQDELLHLQALRIKGIDFLTSEIAFGQIYNESTHAFVYVTETITCQTNGETITETVEHYLYVDAYQGGIVGSDSYMEKCSGFASCAYVEPTDETEPESLEPEPSP